MAVELRFITAALKLNNDLKRMGDLAVHIEERALALMQSPPVKSDMDIPHIGAGRVHGAEGRGLLRHQGRGTGAERSGLRRWS